MRTVPYATLILSAAALLTLIAGIMRGEAAFGVVGALFLLAWAWLSHCLAQAYCPAHERASSMDAGHARARGENAGTHLLDVFDAFARTASPTALAAFQREFEREQEAWRARGRTMPHYVVMALLRRAEATDRGDFRPHDIGRH